MMERVCAPPCCQAVTHRQQHDGRDDVRALSGPEWWRERRHLRCFFFPPLLTLWQGSNDNAYETNMPVIIFNERNIHCRWSKNTHYIHKLFFLNPIFEKKTNKKTAIYVCTLKLRCSLKQKRTNFCCHSRSIVSLSAAMLMGQPNTTYVT